MNLEGSVQNIVKQLNMSANPAHYSGRGATSSDVSGEILEKIYQRIEQQHGEEAAQQFVQMVRDIPKLSATDFLLSFYRLEKNNWQWDKSLLSEADGIFLDGKGSIGGTLASAHLTETDQTEYIKDSFLTRLGIE